MLHSKAGQVLHIFVALGALAIAILAAAEGSDALAIGSSATFISAVFSFLALRRLRREASDPS